MHLHPSRTLLGAALALTLLVGCASGSPDGNDTAGPGDSPSQGAQGLIGDGTDVPMPEATGNFAEKPELSWPKGEASPDLQVQVLSEGDGDMVTPGSVVVANSFGTVWGEDEPFDNSYDRGAPTLFSLYGVIPGWTFGIPDHAIGSRLLMTIPYELGYGAEGNPTAGIPGESTLVFVVDVVDAVSSDAMGQPDATPLVEPADLPVAITGDLGAPAFADLDGAEEPTELAVFQASQGTGEKVEVGQSIAVSFSMTPFDGSDPVATWDGDEDERPGAQVYPIGQGSSWDAVAGMEVGSRVLMLFPGMEGDPALAVVADILAAA